MPCVCIGVGLLGVLLDLSERVLKLCADFAHQRKSVQSVHANFFADLYTQAKCANCARCTLFQKKCAPAGLHKVCRVCTCSASSLHTNPGFSWGKPGLVKMHTWSILNAYLCRHHADIMQTSIQVCIWRTFCSHTPSMHKVNMQTWYTLYADLWRLYADLVQTTIQHIQVFIWRNVLRHLTECFCTW